MRTQMGKTGIVALVVCGMAGAAGAQESKGVGLSGDTMGARGAEAPVTGVDLLALDTSNLGDDAIAIVNTSSPSFTALTGDIPQVGICPEIEYGQDGFLYALDTGDNTLLHRLDGVTGAYIKTFTMTFPAGYNVATAAEWVNGALIIGLTTEGGGGNVGIARISLNEGANTVTFDVTVDLGFSGALGGIAYDPGSFTFYVITSGGSAPRLVSFNDVGIIIDDIAVTENGVAAPGMTALEFGPDGQLYALPNNQSPRTGELFIISRVNAQAVSLGFTGNDGLVSLTTRTGCSSVDLAAPFGQLDFSDVIAFLTAFGAGCP